LYGLNQYRLGRWRPAITALEIAHQLSGDVDQLPVLADSHRALGNTAEVERLWDELRMSGPEAAIMVEGRIVAAGAKADNDDLEGAIRLLEQGPVKSKKIQDYHLRLWYALSDLYERAGEYQKARRGFERILALEPAYMDVNKRLDELR